MERVTIESHNQGQKNSKVLPLMLKSSVERNWLGLMIVGNIFGIFT